MEKNNLFAKFEQIEDKVSEEEWMDDFGEIIFYAFRNNLMEGKYNMTLKELFKEVKEEFNRVEKDFSKIENK